MSQPIIVCSVQHTGSWFAIDFLRKHSNVTGKPVLCKQIRDEGHFPVLAGLRKTVVHFHINLKEGAEFTYPETLTNLVNHHGAIVPIRDPLRAIITRNARHPDLNHNYIVDGFLWLARAYKEMPDKFCFIPINLPIDRQRTMREVLEFADLPYEPYVQKYAKQWRAPPYNVSRNTPAKTAYLLGNDWTVSNLLPEPWAYLHEHADEIAPFLRGLGYRDLMWA